MRNLLWIVLAAAIGCIGYIMWAPKHVYLSSGSEQISDTQRARVWLEENSNDLILEGYIPAPETLPRTGDTKWLHAENSNPMVEIDAEILSVLLTAANRDTPKRQTSSPPLTLELTLSVLSFFVALAGLFFTWRQDRREIIALKQQLVEAIALAPSNKSGRNKQ